MLAEQEQRVIQISWWNIHLTEDGDIVLTKIQTSVNLSEDSWGLVIWDIQDSLPEVKVSLYHFVLSTFKKEAQDSSLLPSNP